MRFCLLTSATIALAVSLLLAASMSVHGQGPTIENQIPKHVPLDIKIKNLNSTGWVHDLEIVVKNTGKKPIYFLFLSLTFDVFVDDGNVRGFAILFGNGNLYSAETAVEPKEDDISIGPGKTYTLKIEESSARGWDLRKSCGGFIEPTKGVLTLGHLSYGDGSGYRGGGKFFRGDEHRVTR